MEDERDALPLSLLADEDGRGGEEFFGPRPAMLVSGCRGRAVVAGATLDSHLHCTITGKFHIHDVALQVDLDRMIRAED